MSQYDFGVYVWSAIAGIGITLPVLAFATRQTVRRLWEHAAESLPIPSSCG